MRHGRAFPIRPHINYQGRTGIYFNRSFVRSMADSVTNAASRLVTVERSVSFIRAVSGSLMNALSRLITLYGVKKNTLIAIYINGVERTTVINWKTLRKEQVSTKEPDTLTFDIKNSDTSTYRPVLGDTITMYGVDGLTLIFGGTVIATEEKVDGLLKYLRVYCKDYSHTLDRQLVAKNYTGQTVAYIVNDLITNYATGFTCVNSTDTTVISFIQFNYLTVSECLKKLANTLSNYSWYVDYSKDIHFYKNTSVAAPFNLTDTNDTFVWNSLSFNTDLSQLRNHVILRGGTTVGNEFSDKKIADGIQNTFFVGYDLTSYHFHKKLATPATATFTVSIASPAVFTKVAHGMVVGDILTFTTTGALPTGLAVATEYYIVSVPTADTFTVSATYGGTAITTTGSQSGTHTYTRAYPILTVGADGITDPTSVDVLYNPNSGFIRFANSNTPAINDTVRWVGSPTYPLIAEKLDVVSIGLYGTYKYVIVDKNITSIPAASQRLAAEIARYSNPISGGSFKTYNDGLLAGQNININSTVRSINQNFKIDRIATTMRSPSAFNYAVSIVTTDNVTMQDVLNKLLITNVADQVDVQQDEVLQIINSANEVVTVTETLVDVSLTHNMQYETVTVAETATTVQALDYPVIFVAGPYAPTGFKRQFMLDSSIVG